MVSLLFWLTVRTCDGLRVVQGGETGATPTNVPAKKNGLLLFGQARLSAGEL